MKLTNRKLSQMHSALRILGNRSMATITADLKVGRLLRIIGPMAEPVQDTRQKIATEIIGGRDVEAMSAGESALAANQINAAQAELDAGEIDIIVPDGLVIREADLPQTKKGDDGWKNASQLGALTYDLGPLYEASEEAAE